MLDECKKEEIRHWSEVKLDIIKEYAAAYSRILTAQEKPSFKHFYIDAFAGAGTYISRTKGEFVPGSPLNALNVVPPFVRYFFIDIDRLKVSELEKLAKQNPKKIKVYHGDCNNILLEHVFPNVRYEDYRRALCLLDPYSMQLDWNVIETVGKMKAIEIFLNFPIGPINRSVLVRNPEQIGDNRIKEMNRVWGDFSWRELLYRKINDMFGTREEKVTNNEVKKEFRKRLKEKAGFEYVPEPMTMCNSKGSPIYYLYFASHKPVAKGIVESIFNKYRMKGASKLGN